jgi:hypothetical protein
VNKLSVEYIKQLREGQSITVYPYAADYGNSFHALGFPCPGSGSDQPLEFTEPFTAQFLSYSGTVIMVRTREYPCLLMDFNSISEVEPADEQRI